MLFKWHYEYEYEYLYQLAILNVFNCCTFRFFKILFTY